MEVLRDVCKGAIVHLEHGRIFNLVRVDDVVDEMSNGASVYNTYSPRAVPSSPSGSSCKTTSTALI